MDNIDYLIKKLKYIDIELNEKQIEQFSIYYDMLIEWNSVMNLTAITEEKDVIDKHFVDSLSINILKEFRDILKINSGKLSIIDIGTGAGFPGIPLKIAFPDIKLTLLDSLKKRINFLDSVISELKLDNVNTYHGRAEEYGRKEEFREKYDLSVSRAVANISTLSEFCIPFVKVNGYFVSYKSEKLENELKESGKAISILGGKLIRVNDFMLPETDLDRKFAIIKKIKYTNEKYPRGQGKPIKTPLK